MNFSLLELYTINKFNFFVKKKFTSNKTILLVLLKNIRIILYFGKR